jgi:hypothetical protein
MSKKPITERSRDKLEDQMWKGLIPAWLSGSFGLCAIMGSLFWRFQMAEWRLLIRYSDGGTVWHQLGSSGELFRGPVPPDVPLSATLLTIVICVAGAAVWWFGGREWRDAHGELVRRREEKSDRKHAAREAARPRSAQRPLTYDPSSWGA